MAIRLSQKPWLMACYDLALLVLVVAASTSKCEVLSPGSTIHRQTEQGAEAENKGLAFAEAGDLKSAEEELRKAVRLAPNNADVLGELGTVLAMQGKFEESTKYLRRAVELDRRNLEFRRSLAANLWQLHRYSEATQTLQVLLAAKPGDPASLLLLGMVSENSGDYRGAVKNLSAVPGLVREKPEAVAALARSYYRIGDIERGREWVRQLQNHKAGSQATLLGAQIADEEHDYESAELLLRSVPAATLDSADLSYRLALVAFHAGRFSESRKLLTTLLDSGHESGEIDELLAQCHVAERQADEAIAALRRAIRIEPAREEHYEGLGKILLTQRRLPSALEVAKEMVQRFPESADAFLLKGNVEQGMGQFTDAIESFSRCTQLDGNNLDGVLGLAQAQASAGMEGEAQKTLENAERHFQANPRIELLLAQVLLRKAEGGDQSVEERARALLNSALRHDPRSGAAHYELGNLELRKSMPKEAVAHLEKAAALEPDDARVHFALSRAYRRLGRNEEAAKESELFEKLHEKGNQDASGSKATAPSDN